MGRASGLVDPECVHVGAKANGALARQPAADGADDAGAAHTLGDIHAPSAQLCGEEGGGTDFLQTHLRMGMDVAASASEFGVVDADPVDQSFWHGGACLSMRFTKVTR